MNKAKHILVTFLSGYLIFAMSGLGIFHHLCSCDYQVTTSILVEKNCCDSLPIAENSCHTPTQGSCGDGVCDDCSCETIVNVFSVDSSITTEQAINNPSRFVQFACLKLYSDVTNTESGENQHQYSNSEDKSPPKAGKYLVILNQSLKIPFSFHS